MEISQETIETFDMSSDMGNSLEGFSEIPLTQQLREITDYNEVIEEDPVDISSSCAGIAASDIGSLLEQFLEYEQASDVDPSSYPDSSFLTPVGSPGDSNEDVVLGRLMIVQEKLSQEVEDESLPNTPTEIDVDTTKDNNNIVQPKSDKLLRTMNGIHPKGNKIRMADSPKFAKFKKKKLGNDPPLRRCFSGPNTPRCTSPSDIVSPEEMKRREAKLIEALALTVPKQQTSTKKANVDKAKRKLSDGSPSKKRKVTEPLPSRLMPVVSKRKKKLNSIDNNIAIKGAVDPRLNKSNYCELANTTQLKNTNLTEINSSENTATETADDIGIVDMTIDHESLAGNIFTVQHSVNKVEQSDATTPVEAQTEVLTSVVEQTDTITPMVTQGDTITTVVTQPAAITTVVAQTDKTSTVVKNNIGQDAVCSNGSVITEMKKENNKKGKSKPPRNYRKGNNLNDTLSAFSDSEPEDKDNDDRSYKRKSKTNSNSHSRSRSPSPSRRYSRSPRSRSPFRQRSRSPHARISKSRSRSRSRSRNRSRSVSRSSRSPIRSLKRSRQNSRSSVQYESDGEKVDISSKLTELSNPVPYDIEHERKLRFLCGGASKGNSERRNIYAGGITRQTTKSELIHRFQRFGRIEKVTLHFRDRGDNYAFIVFADADNATRAIEEGNDDPTYPTLDLCFGGRRKFVGGSYVDFDGNNSYLEGSERGKRNARAESPEDDFDRLLQMAMKNTKKPEKESTPEWD